MFLAGFGKPTVFFVVSSLSSTALTPLTRGFRPLAGFFEVVDVEASETVTLVVAAVFALVVLVGTEGVSFARELVLIDRAIGLDAMAERSTRHCG